MADEKDPANAGGDGKDGKDGQNNDQGDKIEFTPKQQEWLNNKIDEIFAKGHAKGAGEIQTKLAEATTQITALQTEIAELKKPKSKQSKEDDNKDNQRIAQLQAQVDELKANLDTVVTERDTFKTQIEGERKTARAAKFEGDFLAGVEEAGITFFNPKQVLKDVRDELRQEDDGSITVMNLRTGQPRMNTEMRPIKLGDFLAEYARKNPHMVRTEVDGGTGSSASRRHETKDTKKSLKDMSADEFEAFHQKVRSGQATK